MGLDLTLLGIGMQIIACVVLSLVFLSVARRFPRPWNRWWVATFGLAALGLTGAGLYYANGLRWEVVFYGPTVVAASCTLGLGLIDLIDSATWRRLGITVAAALVGFSAVLAIFLEPSSWFPVLSLIQTLLMGSIGALLVGAIPPSPGRWYAVAGVLAQVSSHLFYLSTNVSGLDPTSVMPYGLAMDLTAELLLGSGLLLLTLAEEHAAVSRRAAQLQQLQDQLIQIAEVDPLTGTGTRHALRGWLEAWDETEPLSFLFLDVDGLKVINERHGREAGDLALRMIGEILGEAAGERDLVVHWGDDEFVAIIQDNESASAVRHLARLMRLLDDSLTDFPHATPLRVSWGVATCREKDGISRAISHAQHQMQAMKSRRRKERGNA